MAQRQADKITRIKALRLHLCDGLTQPQAAKLVGFSYATMRLWLKSVEECEEAKALGPVQRRATAPVEADAGGAKADISDDPYAGLPAIGSDPPDDPSPELMAVLCAHWPLRAGDHAALDRLAGWAVGSVKSWFERRGEPKFGALVAQLERAQEVTIGRLVMAMLGSGNAKAMREFLTAIGALPEGAPADVGNGAEGMPASALLDVLAKRRATRVG